MTTPDTSDVNPSEENAIPETKSGARLPLETMDPHLQDIQPGGGVIIHLELAWGYIRRFYLKIFRRSYIEKMKELRKGDSNPCPFEVLDPRDLKVYQNQKGWHWDKKDDPFTWRDNLPFVRVGLAELIVFSAITFGPAIFLTCYLLNSSITGIWNIVLWLAAITLYVFGILIAWFFRNPNRVIPEGEGVVVSPADGKVVLIEEIEHDDFIDGPAVLIGIFLSIFNVHINRTPISAKIIGLRYKAGKYLNALRPESAKENEQVAIRLEGNRAPYRRMVVKQITGAIARRIVTIIKPGDELEKGESVGMIKLGARTELILPKAEGLKIIAEIGQKVQAGSSILAEYQAEK